MELGRGSLAYLGRTVRQISQIDIFEILEAGTVANHCMEGSAIFSLRVMNRRISGGIQAKWGSTSLYILASCIHTQRIRFVSSRCVQQQEVVNLLWGGGALHLNSIKKRGPVVPQKGI